MYHNIDKDDRLYEIFAFHKHGMQVSNQMKYTSHVASGVRLSFGNMYNMFPRGL